jgi:esterase
MMISRIYATDKWSRLWTITTTARQKSLLKLQQHTTNTSTTMTTTRRGLHSEREAVDLAFMKIETERTTQQKHQNDKPLPLVVIHGLFGSKMNFFTFSRAQAREHNRDCYLLDLRNHGSSGHHDTDMSLRSMGLDLDVFLEQQGIEKCDLLGFSLGGKVSMAACLDPELNVAQRVNRLIVGDIAPIKYFNHETWDIPYTMQALLKVDEQVRLGNIKKKSEADIILKENGILNEATRSFLLTNLDRNSNGDYYWKFNLRGLAENVHEIADFPFHPNDSSASNYVPFNKPTLFLVGGRSHLVEMHSPETAEVISTFFPKHRTIVFKDSGHWIHTENPSLFKKSIEEFLS